MNSISIQYLINYSIHIIFLNEQNFTIKLFYFDYVHACNVRTEDECFKNLRFHELDEWKKVEVSSVTDPVCVETVQYNVNCTKA